MYECECEWGIGIGIAGIAWHPDVCATCNCIYATTLGLSAAPGSKWH